MEVIPINITIELYQTSHKAVLEVFKAFDTHVKAEKYESEAQFSFIEGKVVSHPI